MIDLEKVICLDTETTGRDPRSAEILQLAIVRGDDKILFNEYVRPEYTSSWPGAERVHHISPAMVANKPILRDYSERLNEIFENAELIVSYNGLHYDLPIIAKYGFEEVLRRPHDDVMLKFAPIYGDWNDYYGSYRWKNLSVCADYYDYESSGQFHDALEDVRATLWCWKKMRGDI
ncbi:3'-5' exonuclease [Candidatus Saccharibacteria bacterium]|nr:3'-5' exonuclease [Candidatus Saccharibacteria bacterium]